MPKRTGAKSNKNSSASRRSNNRVPLSTLPSRKRPEHYLPNDTTRKIHEFAKVLRQLPPSPYLYPDRFKNYEPPKTRRSNTQISAIRGTVYLGGQRQRMAKAKARAALEGFILKKLNPECYAKKITRKFSILAQGSGGSGHRMPTNNRSC